MATASSDRQSNAQWMEKAEGAVAKNTWFECGEGNGRAPFQGVCPVVQKSSIHWMRGDAGSGHRPWRLIQICELKDA